MDRGAWQVHEVAQSDTTERLTHNHLKVSDSVAFNTFAVLYNHCLCLVPKHLHHPKRTYFSFSTLSPELSCVQADSEGQLSMPFQLIFSMPLIGALFTDDLQS